MEVCRAYALELKVRCGVERAEASAAGVGGVGTAVDEARFDAQLLQKLRANVEEHRQAVAAQMERMSVEELQEEQEAKGYGGWARELDTGDLPVVRRVHEALQQFDESVMAPTADEVRRTLLETVERIGSVHVMRELCGVEHDADGADAQREGIGSRHVSMPLLETLKRQMQQVATAVIDAGHARTRSYFRGQVEAFALYPETSDPSYVGRPSNLHELQARVRARGLADAEATLRGDTCSPFAKALLRRSRVHLEKGAIDYNEFRTRQVVLAELGSRCADGAALEELWALFLQFEDEHAAKTRAPFFDSVCAIRVADGRWLRRPFGSGAFRPRRVLISSAGRLEVQPLASQPAAAKPEFVLESLHAPGVVISRERGERGPASVVRVSVVGQPYDLLLQPNDGSLVAERLGRSEQLGELALTSKAPTCDPPPLRGDAVEPWTLVAESSLFEFPLEYLQRALHFASAGFRAHTPTLDSRRTPARAELQLVDRAEAYRVRVLDLHHKAHEQLVKAAPRGFSFTFLHWVVQELPLRLIQWAKDVADPADFLADKLAAQRRAQRDELVARIERLAAIQQALRYHDA